MKFHFKHPIECTHSTWFQELFLVFYWVVYLVIPFGWLCRNVVEAQKNDYI